MLCIIRMFASTKENLESYAYLFVILRNAPDFKFVWGNVDQLKYRFQNMKPWKIMPVNYAIAIVPRFIMNTFQDPAFLVS